MTTDNQIEIEQETPVKPVKPTPQVDGPDL
jgi:hypothetical protein